MEPVEVKIGQSPVILALPHCGLHVPDDVLVRLNDTGQALADTDWHVDRLYDGLLPDASIVRANFHRYVIDANRSPEGKSLYPGQNTTDLCPLTDFDGKPIYKSGEEPDKPEIEARLNQWHRPYHEALSRVIEQAVARFGVAILYDCHSIRARVPFLFEGVLPDFNIGTDNGITCASVIESGTADICASAEGFTSIINGRFKGGWTTRHYGNPAKNIHAIQMELAQSTYMAEQPPWAFDHAKADRLRPVLEKILVNIENLALSGALHPETQQ